MWDTHTINADGAVGNTSPLTGATAARDDCYNEVSAFPRRFNATFTKASITGTSIRGPMTAAKA